MLWIRRDAGGRLDVSQETWGGQGGAPHKKPAAPACEEHRAVREQHQGVTHLHLQEEQPGGPSKAGRITLFPETTIFSLNVELK